MCPRPSASVEGSARTDETRDRCRTAPRLLTDGGRTSGSLAGEERVDAGTLLERLAAADVVTTDGSGDLFLAGDVRRTWEAGMRRLRSISDAELAAATASAAPFPAEGRIDEGGDWVVVTRTADDDADDTGDEAETASGETGDDVWLSRAHAVADTAAVAALSGRVDALTAARAATPLRLFLETCPACGGTVEETTGENRGEAEYVDDDTGTPVLACVECGEPLYGF